MSGSLGPRVVIAGVASGVGKTTVATGLMASLRARGMRVASAKVGPDFIDPGYHSLATGRPGRNLDSWICGEGSIAPLAARAAAGADLLVVEGVMGLFDGSSDGEPEASTASIARLIDAPVVLVVDASAMSGSVAALVSGYATFDPRTNVAGVVLNRVGSPGHGDLLREALEPLGIPVLGVLLRDDEFVWRDRHLGLVPVAEERPRIAASLGRLADAFEACVDIGALVSVAKRAGPRTVGAPLLPERVVPADERPLGLAVAGGPAFSFVYRDNLEALEAAGADVLGFDPLVDSALPEGTEALFVGGGFPEVYAKALSENSVLLTDLRSRFRSALPTWAECGGLLWLSRTLDGAPLAGVVPTDCVMSDRLVLGYRSATARVPNPVAPVGRELRGHEFHYSSIEPEGEALELRSRFGTREGGFATEHLLASYLHLHLGGDPSPAARFVSAAARARRAGRTSGPRG